MANKSERPKNNLEIVKVPSSLVCQVCECSPDLVRKYRNGKLTGEGMATLRVQIAEQLLGEGLNKLLKSVNKALPFN